MLGKGLTELGEGLTATPMAVGSVGNHRGNVAPDQVAWGACLVRAWPEGPVWAKPGASWPTLPTVCCPLKPVTYGRREGERGGERREIEDMFVICEKCKDRSVN